MKAHKVAVVAYSAPPYSAGGVASAHFNLWRALQRAGLEARLFTFGDYGRKDEDGFVRRGTPPWFVKFLLKLNGFVFRFLAPSKNAYQTVDILKSLVGAKRMSKAVNEFSPDVIVLSDHGAPGLMLKKPKETKIVLVSHHNPARFVTHPEIVGFSPLDVHWALNLEQRVLKKVDAVVCPSDYMKEWFTRSFIFSGPVIVIPNLLDEETLAQISTFDLRAQFNLSPDDIVIYMPSAGSPLKGAGYVWEIIRELCSQTQGTIGFYIPGNVKVELLNEAATLPANARLCLAGQLPYTEHIANVKACSFGLSPSIMENYSMALLEAVHCGVPMVAFATGGNADIVHEDKNGFLVPEGNVEALCAKARLLLDQGFLEQLKQKTLVYSRKELSNQKALNLYMQLIESL